MSRNIPFDMPLSDEDREYLLARGRNDLVARVDEEFPPLVGEEYEPVPAEPEDEEDGPDLEEFGGGDDQIDYGSMNVAELKAELAARGLATDGKKPALIERLEKDDEDGE